MVLFNDKISSKNIYHSIILFQMHSVNSTSHGYLREGELSFDGVPHEFS